MIEWYWAFAIGIAALIAGYLLGKQLAGRSAEPELLASREELAEVSDRSTAAAERVKALEHDLAAAVARAENAEAETERVGPQLTALSGSVAELKQQAADSSTARRAAEAALAAKEAERQKAIDQAGVAKLAATEASDKQSTLSPASLCPSNGLCAKRWTESVEPNVSVTQWQLRRRRSRARASAELPRKPNAPGNRRLPMPTPNAMSRSSQLRRRAAASGGCWNVAQRNHVRPKGTRRSTRRTGPQGSPYQRVGRALSPDPSGG